jgi:pimeloyl-ACP methyl ester carboxylesterase
VLREWRGTLLLYSVLQPLEPFINRRDASVTARGAPVLLIHGLVCNSGAWWWMKRALARRGITCLYTINLEPVLGSIDDYGPQLARRVEGICAATGQDKVFLVCHSMGGLAARVYVDRCGGEKRVAAVLTLGSPHHGTALARPLVAENIRQMQLNSPWLVTLNKDESRPAPVPVTSIYSTHDNLVSPQSGCRLANANNIRLAGVGHVALQFSDDVADLIADFVAKHSTGARP